MRKQTALRGIAAVAAILLIGTLAACAPAEEETKTVTADPNMPVSVTDIVAYFNRAADHVKAEKPEAEANTSVSIPDASIQIDHALLQQVAPLLRDAMELGGSKKGERGSNLDGVMPVQGQPWGARIDPAGVEWATCTLNGESYQIVMKFRDERDPSPLDSQHGKAFDIPAKADILAEIRKKAGTYLSVEDYNTVYSGCIIRSSINRKTGEMIGAEYLTHTQVTARVAFTGSLEKYGRQNVAFTVDANTNCTVTWVSPEDAQ